MSARVQTVTLPLEMCRQQQACQLYNINQQLEMMAVAMAGIGANAEGESLCKVMAEILGIAEKLAGVANPKQEPAVH
jgi:hypothetical protein